MGPFDLRVTPEALKQIQSFMEDSGKKGLQKQIKKALSNLQANPQHPSLHSHLMPQFDEIFGAKVYSSYVQNNTPQAYRILWAYGPEKKQLTVLALIPHY